MQKAEEEPRGISSVVFKKKNIAGREEREGVPPLPHQPSMDGGFEETHIFLKNRGGED